MQSQTPDITTFHHLGVVQWPGNCLVQGSRETETITFLFCQTWNVFLSFVKTEKYQFLTKRITLIVKFTSKVFSSHSQTGTVSCSLVRESVEGRLFTLELDRSNAWEVVWNTNEVVAEQLYTVLSRFPPFRFRICCNVFRGKRILMCLCAKWFVRLSNWRT